MAFGRITVNPDKMAGVPCIRDLHVLAVLHDQGIARVVVGTREENAAVRAVLAKVGARLTETKLYRLPDGSEAPSAWYVHAEPGAG